MESKIRIKMGDVEVDYEGSEGFLKKELPTILEAVSKLHSAWGGQTGPIHKQQLPGAVHRKSANSTSTIAGKLGGKTGTDLAFAASVKLGLQDGRDQFSRDDVLKEMKTATSYYKEVFRKNLSAHLKTLVKGKRLNELGGETYSLANEGKVEAEKALA